MGNASTTRRRLLGGVAGLGAAAGMFGRRVRGQDADPSASPSPCIPSAGATASPVAPWATPPVAGTIRVELALTLCVVDYMTNSDLEPIAEILNTQIGRDFKQFWDIDVKVVVPGPGEHDPNAWLVKFVSRSYGEEGCPFGKNPDDPLRLNGHRFCGLQPQAWVYHDDGDPYLVHAVSHECLEMLANPFLDIVHIGPAPDRCPVATPVPSLDATPVEDQNVAYLQEVCDPCPFRDECYTINGEYISNFVTPAYFDPSNRGIAGVTYDFLDLIRNPFEPVNQGNQNFQNIDSGGIDTSGGNVAVWNSTDSCAQIDSFSGGFVSDCSPIH